MDRPFTQSSDGAKDNENNCSALKGSTEGGERRGETDLTVVPMHVISNGEDKDLEIIALHPECGPKLHGDDTMTGASLVEGDGFLLFTELTYAVYSMNKEMSMLTYRYMCCLEQFSERATSLSYSCRLPHVDSRKTKKFKKASLSYNELNKKFSREIFRKRNVVEKKGSIY